MDIKKMCTEMCAGVEWKKISDELLAHPLLTSIFVVLSAIIIFTLPSAWYFNIVMLGTIIGLSLYSGQKLELFKSGCCGSASSDDSDSAESGSDSEDAS